MQRLSISFNLVKLRSILLDPTHYVKPLSIGSLNTPPEMLPMYLAVPKRTAKIYTRTGDTGTSALFTGERRPKTDAVFHALGTVDELSSCIGMALAHIQVLLSPSSLQSSLGQTCDQLHRIQCRLQEISSSIATPLPPPSPTDIHEQSTRSRRYSRVDFPPNLAKIELEQWIDEMSESLPPLHNFILPSGGLPGTSLQYARSVCRRAERTVFRLNVQSEHPVVEESVLRYLNRLSDYLFTASRFVTRTLNMTEHVYSPVASKNLKP